MCYTAYRLYRRAERLPPDEARAGGVFGWLLVSHRGTLSPTHELVARLHQSHRVEVESLIPELWYSSIKLIN